MANAPKFRDDDPKVPLLGRRAADDAVGDAVLAFCAVSREWAGQGSRQATGESDSGAVAGYGTTSSGTRVSLTLPPIRVIRRNSS